MLNRIALGNFKAFSSSPEQPVQEALLKPITLVFGPNSAGKSSLIHGLLLAHHAVTRGELDVKQMALGGNAVDLGGFHRYIHRRNPEQPLRLDLTFDVGWLYNEESEFDTALGFVHRNLIGTCETFGISCVFERREKDSSSDSGHHVQLVSYEVVIDGERALHMFNKEEDYQVVTDFQHPFFRTLLERHYGTEVYDYLHTESEEGKSPLQYVQDSLHFIAEPLLPKELSPSLGYSLMKTWAKRVEGLFEDLEQSEHDDTASVALRQPETDLDVFLLVLTEKLVETAAWAATRELERTRYLGPLRSYPPRHLVMAEEEKDDWFASGGHAWDVLRENEAVRQAVNRWLSKDYLDTAYRLERRRLLSDEVIDQILPELIQMTIGVLVERIYQSLTAEDGEIDINKVLTSLGTGAAAGTAAGTAAAIGFGLAAPLAGAAIVVGGLVAQKLKQNTANSKSKLPSLEDVLQEVSSTIDAQEVAEVWMQGIAEGAPDALRELVLVDTRTDTEVSHRDVGIGISQLLPVLTYAEVYQDHIIAMEQPELHLHPALQAELGDLFIKTAKERHNTYLIETHSEHLILRLLRRIRETTDGELEDESLHLTPDDIAVLYAEPTRNGTKLVPLRVTPDGDFADRWPRGFFTEREKELF